MERCRQQHGIFAQSGRTTPFMPHRPSKAQVLRRRWRRHAGPRAAEALRAEDVVLESKPRIEEDCDKFIEPLKLERPEAAYPLLGKVVACWMS